MVALGAKFALILLGCVSLARLAVAYQERLERHSDIAAVVAVETAKLESLQTGFDHLFTLKGPAAVIESVHPTSQYAYVQHMHGVRHGEPVPPAILEVTSDDDIRGGVNAGLLVIEPDRALFEDFTTRIRAPMRDWGPKHREHFDAGIKYGFPEQHFLQVEMQEAWTAIDPRFNCMRTDVPHSFGIHWMIGRKPWHNHDNPGRTVSQGLWVIAWETLRLHEPEICTALEERRLVTGKP